MRPVLIDQEPAIRVRELFPPGVSQKEHVVFHVEETPRQSVDEMQVGYDRERVEGRQVTRVHVLVVMNQRDVGMGGLEPVRNLGPAGHDKDSTTSQGA